MLFDKISGSDKMSLLQFYMDFNDLVELSKGEIKPFSKAEVDDEYSFLLYDDKKLHDWHLSDDNEENVRRYPIVADCFIMAGHEHDIISRWGDPGSSFEGLNVSLVIDDCNDSAEMKVKGKSKGWYIEIFAEETDKSDRVYIMIEDGVYSTS